MRNTLLIKRIDLFAQLLGLVIPIVFTLIYDARYLICAYLAVGGVQLISCIVNWFYLNEYLRTSGRTAYEWTLGIVILVAACGMVIPAAIYLCLMVLLFLSPVLAVWYMVMSYNEVRKLHEYVDREQYVKL